MHWVAPGVQDPAHAPLTHAWLVQLATLPHVPLALHVCTPLPEHCVFPGTHTPTQPPPVHAEFEQETGALHCPLAPHVCTELPEHWE